MRFEQVLTFNKTDGVTKFNLEKFCKMRSVHTEDVSHLGKIIRYNVLYKNGIASYRIFFTKWNIVFDKSNNIGIGKFKINDFNIGFSALILPTLFTIGILNNLSNNSAILCLGFFFGYLYLKKK